MDDLITATEYSFANYDEDDQEEEDSTMYDGSVTVKEEPLEIDDDDPEIVLSNKGGLKLIYNGFLYTMHKKQPHSVRWRCVNRSRNCRGSLITAIDYKHPRVRMAHNHKVDPSAAMMARTRFRTIGEPILQQSNLMHNPSKRQIQSPQRDGSTTKAIRIAAQSLVRQMRNIAPAPILQQNSQQHHKQPKTLVLKTIPLKVKQVAPTTIKMPPRQSSSQTSQGSSSNVSTPSQPPEVCLRWNSYHSNMQNSFPSLLDAEQFVDVTLACEGRSLKCHKMILSSCSDYLAQLLRENPCQHPIILMKDLKFWEVEALVKFMYRGEVNVAHDKLPQLLNAAEALQVKGLAGPNPSSQNPKPPMLIPQSKNATTRPLITRLVTKPKENSKPATSASNATPTTTTTSTSSPKRGQKRDTPESSEGRQFTKIRLQRPESPQSPSATVKMEPLDIPLSPTHIFPDNNEDSSNPSNFENLISMHDEDDPGGDDIDVDVEVDSQSGDHEMNFHELPDPPDPNDSEDQMEFVPTDFLEQEPDIVEDSEIICSLDVDDEAPRKHSKKNGKGCEKSDDDEDHPPRKGKT